MAVATVYTSDPVAFRFRIPLWPKAPGSKAPRVPDGLRVYAIGDVHGCLEQLNKLLNAITEDLVRRPARAHLVFLGDLVDRGPDTAGVIERVMGDLPGDGVTFLTGNHEEVMVACHDGDGALCQKWLQYGGLQTLESYSLSRTEIFDHVGDLPTAIRRAVPARHVNFLRSFDDYLELGDYIFVHAGMRPGRALEAQESADLRWIRDGFLNDETDHGAIIVHGHTIVPDIEIRPNRIAVDLGCYQSGALAALVLEGTARGKLLVSRDQRRAAGS